MTCIILLYLLAVYNGDITQFVWGRLEGIAPTTFWPWGQLPHQSRRLCLVCWLSSGL